MKTIRIGVLTGLMMLVFQGCQPAENGAEASSESEIAEEIVIIHYNSEQSAALLSENPDVVVLDVRTPEEYQGGHIKGAVNVNYMAADFESQLVPMDRETAYLVHCQGGGRSGKSLALFRKLGFQKIYHLDDGFGGWVNAGYEVEK